MTRFEVEEIASHVIQVGKLLDDWALDTQEGKLLDDWALDTQEMELELAELERMGCWLDRAMAQDCSNNNEIKSLLSQLAEQINVCTDCIRNRLSEMVSRCRSSATLWITTSFTAVVAVTSSGLNRQGECL